MADSDGEYRDGGSDDEFGDHQVSSSRGTRSGAGGRAGSKGQKGGRKPAPAAAWENVTRTWDIVEENADGTIKRVETAEAKKRARLMRDPTPLQRGIIRHLVLVLDISFAMAEKDLLPTRHDVTMAHTRDFVHEYFEQNPISQLAIVGMRDGIALRISDMSGNPADHLEKLESAAKLEPQGSPSLQNALEMCRGALL
jgi:transcription initiation factor TFIIH subunit 2